MNPPLFPISYLFLMTIISCLLPNSSGADNEQYTNCSQLFQCSNIPNIGYPFWGGTRPQYCGHPNFQLNCQGDAPQTTIQSLPYRVLAIDNYTQTLTVVRDEFWDNTCPKYLYNATLDTTHFSYTRNSKDLTIHFGCQALSFGITFPNQFTCSTNRTNTVSYYVTGITSFVSSNNINFTIACNSSVVVRVNQTAAESLENNPPLVTLKEALDGGFGLRWEANNANCARCVQSGGLCGSDWSSSFACYCSDQPYPLTCNATQNGSGMCPINLVT